MWPIHTRVATRLEKVHLGVLISDLIRGESRRFSHPVRSPRHLLADDKTKNRKSWAKGGKIRRPQLVGLGSMASERMCGGRFYIHKFTTFAYVHSHSLLTHSWPVRRGEKILYSTPGGQEERTSREKTRGVEHKKIKKRKRKKKFYASSKRKKGEKDNTEDEKV